MFTDKEIDLLVKSSKKVLKESLGAMETMIDSERWDDFSDLTRYFYEASVTLRTLNEYHESKSANMIEAMEELLRDGN